MAGRAQWLAERQGSANNPRARPADNVRAVAARGRGDLCRQHGTPLLEVDAQGGRYRKPTCLECLPTHRFGCTQLEYVEKQSRWLTWQTDLLPDSVQTPMPSDADFWDRFEWVPECRCPERRRALEIKAAPPAMIPPAPAFELNIGGKTTGYTWHSLRPRLGRLARQEMGKKASQHWEIEQLAPALDLIPQESPRTRARAILKRLQDFELAGTGLT